ncbi:unnamed protein product, partial [Discosporangium mesarthrocarpum]
MDFGCGTGGLTMLIKDDIDGSIVGVDTSRAMLEQLDRKAGDEAGKKIITTAVELGEGADGSFSFVFSVLALHHIRDCSRVLKTVAGYLRPGGRMVLFDLEATSNANLFHPPDMKVGEAFEHVGICEGDLRRWLEASGRMESLEVTRLSFTKMDEREGGGEEQYQMLVMTGVRTQ